MKNVYVEKRRTTTVVVPTNEEWRIWGRLNQQKPADYPLNPDSSLPESSSGLQEVIAEHIPTSLPRLPWGSHKALIITLHSDSIPLEGLAAERDQVESTLSHAGFDVELIEADEGDDPNEFRKQLANNHWDILHFIGHMTGKENHIGLSGTLSAADFVASCCRSAPPRLVVLNACRSGDTSAETDVAGISGPIAEQFCLRGVDAVIATRWDIWDQASATFSEFFWPELVGQISELSRDVEVVFDVKSALLRTRKKLKSQYSERDACWLAYTLFTSREDGCLIPSQMLQMYRTEGSHPPFFEISNLTKNCEYLAPGGAGLYLMAGPACTGKTTSARMALDTLEIHHQHLCFISLRHDDSMSMIEMVHRALLGLEKAPFHPLVLDDAELLMNHVDSGIHNKLFEISKRVPLLLIMRERPEQENFNLLPFLELNQNPDELMLLRPDRPMPVDFHEYLLRHGFDIGIKEIPLLLNRMQGRLFSLPAFFEAARIGKIDYDLLEYPSDAPIRNRFDSISHDEILALQMISKIATPIISAMRAEIAWTLLQRDGYVSSPQSIFTTLSLLGIAQEYHSPEQIPEPSEIDDEFRSRVPDSIKEIIMPDEKYEFLKQTLGPDQPWDRIEQIPQWVHLLYKGFTLNHNVIDLVKKTPEHPCLILARRACINAFFAVGLGNMPRLLDGYDEPQTLLDISQETLPGEQLSLDSETLNRELLSGANSSRESLDRALEKWFDNPSKFRDAILESDSIVYLQMSQRLPSLRPETILSLGRFVLKNRDCFPLDEPRAADFVWYLIRTGQSDVGKGVSVLDYGLFWNKDECLEILNSAENELQQYPEYVITMQVRNSKLESHDLLRNFEHGEREEKLLLAAKEALEINGDDPLEMYLLHLDYCQVLYRHFLIKGSRTILDAFQAHLNASEAVIAGDNDRNSVLKSRLERGIPQRIWMHTAIALLKQRVEIRKDNDPVSELRWVRDLIEAGHQIGQISEELRRAAITEAASRLLGFKRRKKLKWTTEQNRIRARLTRQIRDRVHADRLLIGGEPLHVNGELHFHFIHSFDRHNTLPPTLEGQIPAPPPTKETERKWYEMMDKIADQFEGFPDIPTDISWILQKPDASNLEMDRILGPLTADATARVAAIMWRGTIHLGDAARIVGAFASTYHECLTPEEKAVADQFRL